MDFILCSSAFVICLALQVSSQLAPKPIGEWSPDRCLMYPNPWVDFTTCKTQKASGLCDYNAMLTEEERNYFNEQRELQEVSDAAGCLCNKSCGAKIRFNFTVAVMKKIGPQITDYRAAAKEFAEKLRPFWKLYNCSLILIASHNDSMGYSEAGPDLINLLSANETERMDRHIYEKYFKRGHFVEGINATLNEYRKALWTVTATTMAPEDQKNSADKIIVGVIVGILVLVILVIIVIIVSKQCKKKKLKLQAEEERGKCLKAKNNKAVDL